MDQTIPLEEFRALGQISDFEIKQELDYTEFDLEDLHHSIDIKEESSFVEPEEINCECYLCGIEFYDKSQLIEHLETQCLEKPFTCEICALRCITKHQLNCHMTTHIGGQIEESKEKEKREKENVATEISVGKTRNERTKETKLIHCKFCAEDITSKNFMRHLERQHIVEKEVWDILKYPRNSKERRRAFGLYRNEINFNLYVNGLTRPRGSDKNASYYPCEFCRGLYLKNYLKRHVKSCYVRKESVGITEGRRTYYLSQAQTVTACAMDSTDEISKLNVRDKVFNYMKVDEISFEAKKDLFIAHFGESYLRKHKTNRKTHVTCSNRLRELSRLLINYRKIVNDNNITFKDLLHSKNFHTVIIAAREVAGYDQVKNTFKAPSLAVHLGTSLKLACDELTDLILKNSKGYLCSSSQDLKTWLGGIRDFKRLVEIRWSTELAFCAYKDLVTKKLNKPTVNGVQQCSDGSTPIGDPEKSLKLNIQEDTNKDSDENYNNGVSQKNRNPGLKRSWSNREIMVLREQFGPYIQNECYPSTKELKQFIKNNKIDRTAPVIKSKLQHLIKLKNK